MYAVWDSPCLTPYFQNKTVPHLAAVLKLILGGRVRFLNTCYELNAFSIKSELLLLLGEGGL